MTWYAVRLRWLRWAFVQYRVANGPGTPSSGLRLRPQLPSCAGQSAKCAALPMKIAVLIASALYKPCAGYEGSDVQLGAVTMSELTLRCGEVAAEGGGQLLNSALCSPLASAWLASSPSLRSSALFAPPLSTLRRLSLSSLSLSVSLSLCLSLSLSLSLVLLPLSSQPSLLLSVPASRL